MIGPELRLGLPILSFLMAADLEAWLAAQPRTSPGMWIKLAKKGSGLVSVTKSEAVDAALCHGWIDGQQHPYDESRWLTRLTPRRSASIWSQVNRSRALELVAGGRMTLAGLAEIEAARADGRWGRAYAPARTAEPPIDLNVALNASPAASAAFSTLLAAERYAILHRLANLKTTAGRARRIAAEIVLLKNAKPGSLGDKPAVRTRRRAASA
ncbi:YdeI family protein [uncultured Enterovirga sp.]|uniref:YdeI/OmpD-associated family protein n=1 Tax=uncultured Enterovirga sp. TaxID=2026352 RepID=UPI0035CA91FB